MAAASRRPRRRTACGLAGRRAPSSARATARTSPALPALTAGSTWCASTSAASQRHEDHRARFSAPLVALPTHRRHRRRRGHHRGHGLLVRLAANDVRVCGKPCAVVEASPVLLKCIAPSMLPYDWDGNVIHSVLAVGAAAATPCNLPRPAGRRGRHRSGPSDRRPRFPGSRCRATRARSAAPRGRAGLDGRRPSDSRGRQRRGSRVGDEPGRHEHRPPLGFCRLHDVNSSVVWEPLPWSGAQAEESPDLSALIGEVTSLPSWIDDGSCVVVLLIEHVSGDGTRDFTAVTSTSAGSSSMVAPALQVSYVLPSPLAQLASIDADTSCAVHPRRCEPRVAAERELCDDHRGRRRRRGGEGGEGGEGRGEGGGRRRLSTLEQMSLEIGRRRRLVAATARLQHVADHPQFARGQADARAAAADGQLELTPSSRRTASRRAASRSTARRSSPARPSSRRAAASMRAASASRRSRPTRCRSPASTATRRTRRASRWSSSRASSSASPRRGVAFVTCRTPWLKDGGFDQFYPRSASTGSTAS